MNRCKMVQLRAGALLGAVALVASCSQAASTPGFGGGAADNDGGGSDASGGGDGGGRATSSSGGSGGGSTSGSGSSGGGGPGSSSGMAGASSGGSSGAASSSGGASGGASGSGTSSSGGADAGASGGDAGFDPTEVARVAGWIANASTNGLSVSLNGGAAGPSGAAANIGKYFPVGSTRDRLVDSIVGACAAFAPQLPNWIEYCEAIVASAIVSESTYNPTEVVNDSYSMSHGGGMDPTVGLLQVRFSSTVHDYQYDGPLSVIASIGCSWPSNLASLSSSDASWNDTGANYLSFMEDPACNVPLATWYYFLNATGNGGANPVYAAGYCTQGQAVAGDVVVGLISHLMGPGFTRPDDPNNAYPAGIDYRFNLLVGQSQINPSAQFTQTLQPNVAQYCSH